ncbi:hypothetical protein ACFQMA_01025 [Halosimplex aquaticum]|uniref:Uncharacterized protein n=1 Tax=Halosimplex aquaticum TaxID=3026162 RepID=A0ABD5XY14_9EURY|nr:hypothetical protein [Halosimplex aquaticum]
MSNGFGAAFGGMMLLAVLSGMALLLGISLAGIFVLQRRTGSIPRFLRYLSFAVVVGVILIAGFSVAALFDEATMLATVFLAIVFVPLGVVTLYLHRENDLSRIDIVVTTGVAWSIPFLIGVPVTIGVPVLINRIFGLSPAESRQLGVYWIASVVGAIVVVFGALRLSRHVSKRMITATSS